MCLTQFSLITEEASHINSDNESFALSSSFMRTHAQAMNEYRGDEMSTEVVQTVLCGRKLWSVDEVKVS